MGGCLGPILPLEAMVMTEDILGVKCCFPSYFSRRKVEGWISMAKTLAESKWGKSWWPKRAKFSKRGDYVHIELRSVVKNGEYRRRMFREHVDEFMEVQLRLVKGEVSSE